MLNLDPPRIRVAVQYADPLVAIGLSTVLSQQQDIDLVGQPRGAVADIVIADYRHGLSLAHEARRQGRSVRGARVLVIATQDREHDVRNALEAGVEGYLELGCAVQDFVHGVRQLARGARYLSVAAAARIAESMAHSVLTQREQQVLVLVARGKSNKAIALVLDISIGTVKAHMKGVMGKLGAVTRTEAASIAGARGMVPGN
jgi:DNA-binding NarL/FixJ family response regulator